jgi:hypothetical protein
MNSNQSDKAPPLGLRPRWLATEVRAHEIIAAMLRFRAARKPIPAGWLEEFADCNLYLVENGKVPVARPTRYPDAEVSSQTIAPGKSAAEEAMGVEFGSARESLMQAHGATADEIRATVDPLDANPDPGWYERMKIEAIRYKEVHGTVRTKHLLAVGAGVQSVWELRYCSDGPKRAAAFVALLDADLMVREATGKGLDVKALPSDDDI